MHIVIIGNGITGITAARHIRKLSDHKITVISSETEHFFSRTALMYVYMGHMMEHHLKPYEDQFWKKNRIELVHDHVEDIDFNSRSCSLRSGVNISYDKLVIATGSTPNTVGFDFSKYRGVQGMYSWQDLKRLQGATPAIRQAVVIGGGLIGIELAEMLHTRNIPVTFLIKDKSYWKNVLPPEESALVTRHIAEHKINLRFDIQVSNIIADEQGNVQSVITADNEEIKCDFAGITVGVNPNISFLKNTSIETGRGVLISQFFETSIEDVYAAGDCAEFRTHAEGQVAVEQLWYTGRMQGEALAKILCGERTPYDRGIWFNSAKFFDIEYQTYGIVPSNIDAPFSSFYWEDNDGKKCLRIVFRNDGKAVTGFNLLGIRFRQEVCEQWIRENKTVEFVMEHLPTANFDPEFYKQHEEEMIRKFNAEHGTHLSVKTRRGLFSRLNTYA